TISLSNRSNARLWVGAYLAANFGTAALFKTGVVPGWPGMALFAASFLLLLPLARSVERAQIASGNSSLAMRIYSRRVIAAGLVYVVFLLGGMTVARVYAPPVPARVLMALAVALPVLFMIRAMALLLRDEQDEYLRMRVVNQSLVATGFLLTIATLYGFLNAFDVAPRIDAWAAFPVWAAGLGLGRLFQKDGVC
ncbi:MAG: hypothetical protein ABIW33_04340, partial [Sphingomicrobium sp.]